MKRKHLNISAKIVSIFYIVFITMFSFDAENLVGWIIHLLPTFIFTACLIIAWFKPKIGGILFALAGIGTIIVFNTYRDLFVLIAVSIIPVITGILFFLSKKK